MALNVKNFNSNLNKIFLHEKNPKIAVGISGGPDSIALTLLLNSWVKRKKGDLIALIVDHKIRKESFDESIKTKKYLFVKKIKSKILFVSKNKVLQGKPNQARTNRFEKMTSFCKLNKIFHLFLAHHYDDNIETFLIRKVAGSNFEGLNCMQNVSYFNTIQIVRPLLTYTKKEIIEFNKKNNLDYILDPSNKNIKYTRVAIREFILSNKKICKNINDDFKIIKKNYKNYIKMIFQIFNLLILEIRLKKIILDARKFILLNQEIQSKIFLNSLKYVNSSNYKIRTKKIDYSISKILNNDNISLNLSNTLIKRIGKKIVISHN